MHRGFRIKMTNLPAYTDQRDPLTIAEVREILYYEQEVATPNVYPEPILAALCREWLELQDYKDLEQTAHKTVEDIEEIRLAVLRKHPDGTDHRPEHYEPRLTMSSVLRATEDLRKALGIVSGTSGMQNKADRIKDSENV